MMVKPRTFFLSVALGLALSASTGYVFFTQLQRVMAPKAATQATHAPQVRVHTACPKVIQVTPQLSVKDIEFGMIIPDEANRPVFVPTDTIVRKPGYGYGWRARVVTPHERLSMKEVLALPEAPQMWGIGPEVQLSSDRTTATTTTTVTPHHGWISNSWWFTEGDPSGTYTVELHLEGRKVVTRTFEVR